MVGGGNNGGAGGFWQGCARGGKKMEGIWSINRGNVATFRFNVATFPRAGVPTSRRSRGAINPTSRRWDPTSRHSREWKN